ncbi:MFS transporter [Promicromonospora thailandica]|uniref:Arabinose efflux permease, MFS family n=1 Tax=Promicromonospora thailandica TaxID=765201 RepID=A0A9X2G514_9MICO|nr:MFS transporter [Promicromonospora thailandica]MCP2265452.1 putative arabinose efflux permease, MFS family [Promicromonospora thailandica]BFF17001.1 MFS transporter [Promicromonospora thailandica]
MSTGPGAARFDERRLLVALFGAGTAAFAQLYAPQSVLPDAARELATSASATALLVSAATLGLAVGVLPWAWVADRVGRVRAMTVAMLGATTVGLAVPFAPSFGLIVAGRAVEGLLVAGVPAVAMAYLTEMLPAAVVPRAAGTYVAGTSMGGLLGRLVSGGVAELLDWRAGVAAVALACLVATGLFVWLAPRDRGPRARTATPDPAAHRAGRFRALLSPRLLVLDAQGLLLMGGFVAVYNYLGFRLAAEPFGLSPGVVSLVFLAYLAGTWSSARTGRLVVRYGRRRVLVAATGVMALGVVATLSGRLPVVLAGLVVLTAGFFGAHAVASGWTPVAAPRARTQAAAVYNLAYYAGSSLFGWLGGVGFALAGWPGTVGMVLALVALAASLAVAVLHD